MRIQQGILNLGVVSIYYRRAQLIRQSVDELPAQQSMAELGLKGIFNLSNQLSNLSKN